MIELNNIDFSSLEKTCELPVEYHNDLWDAASSRANSCCPVDFVLAAFELGASLAHQQETKKVCMLLKSS